MPTTANRGRDERNRQSRIRDQHFESSIRDAELQFAMRIVRQPTAMSPRHLAAPPPPPHVENTRLRQARLQAEVRAAAEARRQAAARRAHVSARTSQIPASSASLASNANSRNAITYNNVSSKRAIYVKNANTRPNGKVVRVYNRTTLQKLLRNGDGAAKHPFIPSRLFVAGNLRRVVKNKKNKKRQRSNVQSPARTRARV